VLGALPNPSRDGDAGEYVVVQTAGVRNLTLDDGESRVPVPPDADVVVLASDPGLTRDRVDRPVVAVDLSLSNGGERLELRRGDVVVHRVSYADAPEGERWNATADRWTPRGLLLRPVVSTGPASATAFVLPDAPEAPLAALAEADDRLYLAGYTLSSTRVADALVDAQSRGVRVRVLVEGGPVGGMTARQAATLDRLTRAGVAVRVVDGPEARFSFHHAKYAVADDRAVVLTENWKPAGTGGRDSRGWGVDVSSERTADELAAVFAHDFGGRDAIPWTRSRGGRTFVEEGAATEQYSGRRSPAQVAVREVRVLTAPGNAGEAVVAAVDGAEHRVDVVQPRIDPEGRFFEALVRAARRGVRVRLLLSNAWYDRRNNRAVVNRTRELRTRGLPIETRVADPKGRFGKVHAKGAVVDDETALVGSLNWNDHAATENREVVLGLRGPEPAAYYRRAFEADWRESAADAASGSADRSGDDRPTGVLAGGAVAAAVLAAVVLKKTVRFEGDP
jgi:phosphatidylserine/phosphatidylglycerophosphate/cardiolipin synthase-like enzyme